MRVLLLLAWIMTAVMAGFYHGGPGQQHLLMDEIDQSLNNAEKYVAAGNWSAADSEYERALTLLPVERQQDLYRVRLQRAKAQMQIAELPEAHLELTNLVEEMREGEETLAPELFADAQQALANSQYYMTWLMRLEGLPRDEWEPEIEAARQTYRLLSEQALDQGDSVGAKRNQEDLESVIRLARMDLSELQGLSIPTQCKGCKSGQCKGTSKRKGRKEGNKGQPKDVRGASSGPPPDNTGS